MLAPTKNRLLSILALVVAGTMLAGCADDAGDEATNDGLGDDGLTDNGGTNGGDEATPGSPDDGQSPGFLDDTNESTQGEGGVTAPDSETPPEGALNPGTGSS